MTCECRTSLSAAAVPSHLTPSLVHSRGSAEQLFDTYFSKGYALTDPSVAEPGVTLVGDAYIADGFGVHLDGEGDSILVDLGTSYGSSGSFSLSFW